MVSDHEDHNAQRIRLDNPEAAAVDQQSGAPDSPIEPAENDQTAVNQEDSEDGCSICLHQLEDRTVIPNCSHEFCFECLVVWIGQSRKCPLCNQGIGEYIIHDIRSRYDYRKHFLPPLRTSPPTASQIHRDSSQAQAARRHALRRRRERERSRREELSEIDKFDRSLAKRRWVYRHNLYAKHVASNSYTKYRPYPSPATFAASPDLISRTTAFLRRELQVWEGVDVEFLTTLIISLMKSIDIRSESAVKLLSEFLDLDAPSNPEGRHANAEHFAHEVYCYVRSPYKDLFMYDSVVQYDTPPELQPPPDRERRRRWDSTSRSRSRSRSRDSRRPAQQAEASTSRTALDQSSNSLASHLDISKGDIDGRRIHSDIRDSDDQIRVSGPSSNLQSQLRCKARTPEMDIGRRRRLDSDLRMPGPPQPSGSKGKGKAVTIEPIIGRDGLGRPESPGPREVNHTVNNVSENRSQADNQQGIGPQVHHSRPPRNVLSGIQAYLAGNSSRPISAVGNSSTSAVSPQSGGASPSRKSGSVSVNDDFRTQCQVSDPLPVNSKGSRVQRRGDEEVSKINLTREDPATASSFSTVSTNAFIGTSSDGGVHVLPRSHASSEEAPATTRSHVRSAPLSIEEIPVRELAQSKSASGSISHHDAHYFDSTGRYAKLMEKLQREKEYALKTERDPSDIWKEGNSIGSGDGGSSSAQPCDSRPDPTLMTVVGRDGVSTPRTGREQLLMRLEAEKKLAEATHR